MSMAVLFYKSYPMIHNILKDKSTKLFIVLGGIFIASALIAEVIGVKILWPVVFIMTDIINEYYGSKGVKFLSYLTIGLITYAFMIFTGAINLAPSEYFSVGNGIEKPDNAFRGIFGQGMWIIIGSMVAFLVGQILDVLIFHRIKKLTGEKNIWFNIGISTGG